MCIDASDCEANISLAFMLIDSRSDCVRVYRRRGGCFECAKGYRGIVRCMGVIFGCMGIGSFFKGRAAGG